MSKPLGPHNRNFEDPDQGVLAGSIDTCGPVVTRAAPLKKGLGQFFGTHAEFEQFCSSAYLQNFIDIPKIFPKQRQVNHTLATSIV